MIVVGFGGNSVGVVRHRGYWQHNGVNLLLRQTIDATILFFSLAIFLARHLGTFVDDATVLARRRDIGRILLSHA